jgi:hypothetical protein
MTTGINTEDKELTIKVPPEMEPSEMLGLDVPE